LACCRCRINVAWTEMNRLVCNGSSHANSTHRHHRDADGCPCASVDGHWQHEHAGLDPPACAPPRFGCAGDLPPGRKAHDQHSRRPGRRSLPDYRRGCRSGTEATGRPSGLPEQSATQGTSAPIGADVRGIQFWRTTT
jgi:hypothetical protein